MSLRVPWPSSFSPSRGEALRATAGHRFAGSVLAAVRGRVSPGSGSPPAQPTGRAAPAGQEPGCFMGPPFPPGARSMPRTRRLACPDARAGDRPRRAVRLGQVAPGRAARAPRAAPRRLLQGGRRPDAAQLDLPAASRSSTGTTPSRGTTTAAVAAVEELCRQAAPTRRSTRSRPDGRTGHRVVDLGGVGVLRGRGDLRPGDRQRVPAPGAGRRCGVRDPAPARHVRTPPLPRPARAPQAAVLPATPRPAPARRPARRRRARRAARLPGGLPGRRLPGDHPARPVPGRRTSPSSTPPHPSGANRSTGLPSGSCTIA